MDKIHKTMGRNMLLVLTKENKDKEADITKTVAAILGREAIVVSKGSEGTIEIRDLDATTTNQAISELHLKTVSRDSSITLHNIEL